MSMNWSLKFNNKRITKYTITQLCKYLVHMKVHVFQGGHIFMEFRKKYNCILSNFNLPMSVGTGSICSSRTKTYSYRYSLVWDIRINQYLTFRTEWLNFQKKTQEIVIHNITTTQQQESTLAQRLTLNNTPNFYVI